MKKAIVSAGMYISCLLLIVACSSSDDGNSTPQSFDEYEFSGIFRGTLYSNGSTSQIEGYVTIEENGTTILNLLTGRMKGVSVKVGDDYNITINEVTGLFEDVTNITGSIEISTRTLYLTGTNPDGSQMTVGGNAAQVIPTSDPGWNVLTKSAVVFTHNESCKASITINGLTLSGLNGFYHEGGLCDSYYNLHNTIRSNLDNLQSEVLCNTGTITGLDGNPLTFTDCNTTRFILDKNTEYTYTVVWENGEVSTGEFTSSDGGYQLPICLSNNGPECEGDGELVGSTGNPRFNLQFTADVDLDLYVVTPNGTTIYYGNSTGQGGELDVDCACGDSCGGENIFWSNGPSGQYQYYVKYFGSCGTSSPAASYTIKVLNGNNVSQTRTGTLNDGQQSQTWTYTHP